MAAIAPGSTIGILGGGQLGRMTALAARRLGYHIHVLDPDPQCAAGPVSDRCVTASFDDVEAAADLARHCHVVTFEIEQIALASIEAASRHAPVRPGAAVLGVLQDRSTQKEWLATRGFPVGRYRDVTNEAELVAAAEALGPLVVKSRRGGYDGRSQVRVDAATNPSEAWSLLGHRSCIAEQALDLESELSVMVARRPNGETRSYAPALNHHERQILAWSVIPAPLAPETARQATDIAREIADAVALEGLLAVEMFLCRDGLLLVNELAPRPHNSFHETEVGCATSQFEQCVRAVCDLPLGDPSVLRPAAIVNLFGDLWLRGTRPDFQPALTRPGVQLHLYGKPGPRAGRKMGHLSAIGDTPEDALARARGAAAAIGAGD